MKAFLFCIVIACALAVIAGNATGKKKESSSSSSEEDKKAKNGTKTVVKPSVPAASNIKAQSGDAPPTPPNGNKQASADSVAPAIKAAATDIAKAPSGNSETTTAANRGSKKARKISLSVVLNFIYRTLRYERQVKRRKESRRSKYHKVCCSSSIGTFSSNNTQTSFIGQCSASSQSSLRGYCSSD